MKTIVGLVGRDRITVVVSEWRRDRQEWVVVVVVVVTLIVGPVRLTANRLPELPRWEHG